MNNSDKENGSRRSDCLMRILKLVALLLVSVLICMGVKYLMNNNTSSVLVGGVGNVIDHLSAMDEVISEGGLPPFPTL